jgi:spermidine/putrescine transport system substrate-binding protein
MDKELHHSAPYMITYVGIGYLKSKVKELKPTWNMLGQAQLKGRMTMLNDMRETIGAALKSLGYSLNTVHDKELAEARDLLIRWKKNLAKFESEQYKTGLASGEFFLVHGYSGDILKVQEENDDIEFMIPEEGYSLASDDLIVPKDARNTALAHKFINFLHDPQVAAENTEYITYLCPNKSSYALLSENVRSNPGIFAPEQVRKKGEAIRDLGEDNAKYIKIWDQVKAAE